MGFVSKIFGGGGDKAAGQAADVQSAAAARAEAGINKRFKETRKDLAPFKELGTRNIGRLESLTTDPEAQLDFINNNPFFESLMNRSSDTLFNNQAAKGKVGSGGTAEALQNSFLLLGSDLLNQNISQTQNLVTTGQSAAAQTGQFGAQAAQSVANLTTGAGNAQAAGIVGAAQNRANATGSLIDTALGIGSIIKLSDGRTKTDFVYMGDMDNGISLWFFRYIGSMDWMFGAIAQRVEKILPDAVIEKSGVKYVNYTEVLCQA